MIYLDYNATTPVDPEVALAMRPWIDNFFGNPSSLYRAGREAREAVENARSQVANLIHASASEIVFTSGGTESNNFAIKGIANAYRNRGNHIIVSEIEHPAVLEVCKYLESQGYQFTYLPVDEYGRVSPEQLREAITSATILVSVMHSNNEVGTLQPIAELAAITHAQGAIFHTDAAQSAGKVELDVESLGVDLLSIAGHKLYAPKGIGALYIRKGVNPEKLIHGASQEQDRRAGTENILEIAGLGKACEIALRDLQQNSARLKALRDTFKMRLQSALPAIRLNGHPEHCLPNTVSVGFPGIDAQTLLSELETIAASPGAACHAAGHTVSHVLKAMKVPDNYMLGTIRFSVGKFTSDNDIYTAVDQIVEAYQRLLPGTEESSSGSLPDDVRLTAYTHGLGCACKLNPGFLDAILKDFPLPASEHLLVGLNTNDDAAVYKLTDTTALVQTLDFFTPVCNNPYDFGAIAAVNALSDIYAMGARPLFALNIAGFPYRRLPAHVLKEIFRGANDKVAEAGIFVAGGHSIENSEPLFGMCVTGTVQPEKIWRNSGALPGDVLILTKPLGSGIIATAVKTGLASVKQEQEALDWMKTLNAQASEIMQSFEIHACTDISGFGLLGHLAEITRGSGVTAVVRFRDIPLMSGIKELAMKGAVSGGSRSNLQNYTSILAFDNNLDEMDKLLLCDAQTSGGLLFSLPDYCASDALKRLKSRGIQAAIIGEISAAGNGAIKIQS